VRPRTMFLCVTLMGLAATACGREYPSIQLNAQSDASASAPESACTNTPAEGIRTTETRSFTQFGSRLSPAKGTDVPTYDGRVAFSKAEDLGMLPADKANCTEVIFGVFTDQRTGVTSVPAWAVIVHTSKVWSMDLGYYWTECAKRGATCPTPTSTGGVSPYETVVVLDAVTGSLIRQLESPAAE